MPLVRAQPLELGPKAEPGAKPNWLRRRDGGAQPRLTSGGRAGAEGAQGFARTSGALAEPKGRRDLRGRVGQWPNREGAQGFARTSGVDGEEFR
jgi:hypothetical protein